MDKGGNGPQAHSALGEARGGRKEGGASLTDDLEALEAALLAKIEAFDLRAMTAPPMPEAELESEPETAPIELTGEILRQFLADPAPAAMVSAAPPAVASPQPAAPAPAPRKPAPERPKGSLLAELRQQAQAKQNERTAQKQAEQEELKALSRKLDAALRRIFSYCHDLVQQLDILHPPVAHRYSIAGVLDFSGLEWRRGFAEYRTQPESAGAIYELVSLSCQLAGPGKQQLERPGGVATENLRKTLFDYGLAFDCDEVRNFRREVERMVFSVPEEVKINLRWHANLQLRAIVLETRNLERFGSQSYLILPEAVGTAMLDELGRLLLGQPNSFRDYCSRQG
ncbi:MAG: hypothetical protein H6R10_2454 [Rhodocyclaceae bacterium]|nr:hypothetical protein [Rhodocyclaceae bacterium]